MDVKINKQFIDHFDYIEIVSEHVSKELIEEILFSYPNVEEIKFSPKVKYFDDESFFQKNCAKFKFDTATNLVYIGKSAFERAYNINVTGAFTNVEKLGKNAFSISSVNGYLCLFKVKSIPNSCFNYAQIDYLALPSLKDGCTTAFKFSRIGKIDLPEDILVQDRDFKSIKDYNMYIEK